MKLKKIHSVLHYILMRIIYFTVLYHWSPHITLEIYYETPWDCVVLHKRTRKALLYSCHLVRYDYATVVGVRLCWLNTAYLITSFKTALYWNYVIFLRMWSILLASRKKDEIFNSNCIIYISYVYEWLCKLWSDLTLLFYFNYW